MCFLAQAFKKGRKAYRCSSGRNLKNLIIVLIRRLRPRAEPHSIPPRSSTPKSTSLDKRDPGNPIAFLICLQRPQYAFGTVPVSHPFELRDDHILCARYKKRSTLQIHQFASAEFFFAERTGLADDQVIFQPVALSTTLHKDWCLRSSSAVSKSTSY